MSRLVYLSKTQAFIFSPWMCVESICRAGGSLLFDTTLKAASLQSFALNEAPREVVPHLISQGALHYGKALSLMRTQLRRPNLVLIFAPP